MLDAITDKISDYLINNKAAKEEDRDVYKYGLAVLIYNIFLVLFIIVLSFILHNIFETLFFIGTLIVMRKYTGGHHANTRVKCFATTVIVYTLTVIASALAKNQYVLLAVYVSLLFSYIIMLLYAPVSQEQIKWSDEKMKVVRKCNRICLIVFVFIISILNYFKLTEFAVYISFAIVSTTVSLVIEILKVKGGK